MFDVVIVGGGAAGCVLAARLADGGERSVALVEAGPDLRAATPPALREGWRLPAAATLPDWELDAEPDQAGTVNRLRRGRVLGGTSWLTRFAVRGAAADFDRWAARGNPGWAFAEVLPAFCRLETDLEFGDAAWHGAGGPIPITRYPELAATPIHEAAVAALVAAGTPVVDDHNRPDAVGVGRLPMSSRRGRRVTALDGYLDPVPPSVEIRPDAPVVRVVLEGRRATGVELADGSVIPAGWVVLSAGTYGSPAILLRSGIGPGAHLRAVGIDPIVDLVGVGENLADHPGVDLDVGWSGPATEGPVLHAIATSRSAFTGPAAPPDVILWISDPLGDDARFFLDPILLKPESRGTVRLRSADPLAAPRITLPGIRTEHDLRRLIDAYRANLALANAPGIRALASGPAPREPTSAAAWREHVIANSYSLPHVVGTCAMGPDPTAGAVVDARARVHGVERLSVVDASIIPEPPSGFPHLITIMLAEHLSAMAGTGWS